jgi:hypothetical protein
MLKIPIPFLFLILLLCAGCNRGAPQHPFVEPGMSRAEVTEIMGTPLRIDSIRHVLSFDLGYMTVDLLDSLRLTLDETDGNNMLMGHPVCSSSADTTVYNWYYGPEVVDTMFTIDSAAPPRPHLERFWYSITKQRAVTFDGPSGRVLSRGFVVLRVAPR